MIVLKNISKVFHDKHQAFQALHRVNLQVNAGEIFGIVGASGAGKSTLLRCVNLLERPCSGEVIVDGQSLLTLDDADLRQARQNIGMIFQHFNLLNSRNVFDNVAFPLEIAGIARSVIEEKVTSLLHLTGLDGKAQQFPHALSGGQKQRVAIARALACGGHVLLCDEATSALDPETTQSILTLLERIRDELNLTILLITHEMSVVKSICDRVAIMENGELVEEAETGQFFAYPKTPLAQQFVQHTLQAPLPKALQKQLQADMHAGDLLVLRLWFWGHSAAEPILQQFIQRFSVEVNILQANLDYVHHHPVGIMIVTLKGAQELFDQGIAFLTAKRLKVESLGFIPDHSTLLEES